MTWISPTLIRNLFGAINVNKLKCVVQNNVVKIISAKMSDKLQMLENFKLHHWPFLMSGWFALTLITTYAISVGKKHAYKFFPYISDTGTYSPESCIFGQMVNLGTLLMVLNIYLRYSQLKILSQICEIEYAKWNRGSLWFAIIACLGMSIVANFQKTNLRGVHFLGADMVLGGGVVYTIIQAKISYSLREIAIKNPDLGITNVNILLRIVISAACVLLFFILIGFGYDSEKNYEGDLIWWTPDDNGYVSHVIATISEWLIIMLILVFILSYTNEFKAMEFHGIQFKIKL